jgi:hypothetical protein
MASTVSFFKLVTLCNVTSCVLVSNTASCRDSEALLQVKPQLTHPRKRTSHHNQDVSERSNNPAEALELFDHFKNAVDLWMPKNKDGRFLSAFEYLP